MVSRLTHDRVDHRRGDVQLPLPAATDVGGDLRDVCDLGIPTFTFVLRLKGVLRRCVGPVILLFGWRSLNPCGKKYDSLSKIVNV